MLLCAESSSTPSTPSRELYLRVLLAVMLLTLYWLFGALYEEVVAARFSFGGFEAKPAKDQWIPLILVVVSSLLLPVRPQRMSQIFVWLSVIFLLLPAAVLSAKQSSDLTALITMFSAVASVRILCIAYSIMFPMVGSHEVVGPIARIKMMPLVGIQLIVLAMLAWHVKGAANFSFLDVYDYRSDFNESVGFPLNYLLPFAAGPLVGLIAACALEGRRLFLFLYLLACGALFFGFSSHKVMAFYPVLALFAYLTIRSSRGFMLMIVGLISMTLLALFSDDEVALIAGSAFANRLVFIPAQIHFTYFEVFENIGYQFWAESKVGLGLSQSTLLIDAVNYIALVMTGDSRIGANSGWIANGYMNAGVVGIAVYAICLSVILHFIDLLGYRYGYAFIGTAFTIPIFSLVNSIDLLAGILTGGMAALFAVFWLFVRPIRHRWMESSTQQPIPA